MLKTKKKKRQQKQQQYQKNTHTKTEGSPNDSVIITTTNVIYLQRPCFLGGMKKNTLQLKRHDLK